MYCDILIVLAYVGFIFSGLMFFNMYIERCKEKSKGEEYFKLDEDNKTYRYNIKDSRGPFIITVTELTKNGSKIENGASSCFMILYTADTNYSISRMQSIAGNDNERIECDIISGKLRIMYRPSPRNNMKMSRYYRLNKTEL